MSPMSSYSRNVLTGTPVRRDRPPTVITIVSAPLYHRKSSCASSPPRFDLPLRLAAIVGGARQPQSELAQRRRSLCTALRPIDPAGIASRRIGICEEVHAVEENGR